MFSFFAYTLLPILGYPGFFLIVFAESGFLLGAVLPGDSLLFAAGLFATSSRGIFHIVPLVLIAIVAAILGDSFGYWCGLRFGPRIFAREDSFFFKKEYVTATEQFYTKYGKKTVVLARFVPVVRTFAPIFAGVGKMRYRDFLLFNIIGGIIWGAGVPLAGYFLGRRFPQAEHYFQWIILAIIVLSVLPVLYQYFRTKKITKE